MTPIRKRRVEMGKPETLKIDDVEYVRADSVKEGTSIYNGMDYVIIRTEKAGVFAGYLQSRDGAEAALVNARRLWYWDGAASLSQLAMEGVSQPDNCKFPCEVDLITLIGVIEVISATEQARKSIKGVKIWKK